MFIETIAISKGRIRNLNYHSRRMQESAGLLDIDLEELLSHHTDQMMNHGYYKLRIVYSEKGVHAAEVTPYTLRPVQRLMAVEIPRSFEYRRKYANRSQLDRFGQGLPADTIPLLVQNGLITDTTYTNVCFRKSSSPWVTPSTPLLNGTMRQFLLDEGVITTKKIELKDILSFDEIALINAMIPLGEVILPIASVNFGIFDR